MLDCRFKNKKKEDTWFKTVSRSETTVLFVCGEINKERYLFQIELNFPALSPGWADPVFSSAVFSSVFCRRPEAKLGTSPTPSVARILSIDVTSSGHACKEGNLIKMLHLLTISIIQYKAEKATRSTTKIWVVNVISMEFLRSFLRRRFARAQVATSRNVGCFLRLGKHILTEQLQWNLTRLKQKATKRSMHAITLFGNHHFKFIPTNFRPHCIVAGGQCVSLAAISISVAISSHRGTFAKNNMAMDEDSPRPYRLMLSIGTAHALANVSGLDVNNS